MKDKFYIAICMVGLIFLAYYMSDMAIWLVKPRNDLMGVVQEPCQDAGPSCDGDESIFEDSAS